MSDTFSIPSVNQPVSTPPRLLTNTWFRFLWNLWQRSGGAIGVAALPSYLFADLPTGLADGSQALITDAAATTFHTAAVGGGTNVMPVILLGGVWRYG